MGSSPAPPPSSDNEPRFKSITSPCECVEDYRPGGYHPVHLDDLLNDGQYKIIRKLGEGSYSTVWLAHNLQDRQHVALKILVSDILEPIPELQILQHITRTGTVEGSQYVTQLIGKFIIHGPNGIHTCLVFEPMGPSVNSMVEELPQFKPRLWGMKVRYPFWMAKSILKQTLQALTFLHSKGIAHGDFQPGNMLFCLDNIDSEPEDRLRQQTDTEFESVSPAVQRLDGKLDPWAPRYLCVAQPLVPFTNYGKGFRIKLSDMGGAYFFTDPPARIITPRGLRAPELIFDQNSGRSLDIWSFGCLIFELITGRPLFCVPYSEFEDDDHLLQLSAHLGALPDELFKRWKTSSWYYTAEKRLFNCQVGGIPKGGEPLMIEQTSMEELFDQADTGLDEEEAHHVKTLIRRVLKYDPGERPSLEEILDDPLFR